VAQARLPKVAAVPVSTLRRRRLVLAAAVVVAAVGVGVIAVRATHHTSQATHLPNGATGPTLPGATNPASGAAGKSPGGGPGRPTASAPQASGSPGPTLPGGAPSPPGAAVPGTGAVVGVPGTVASDCSVNVSQALESWISSVPDGANLSFRSGGCYLINAGLRVVNRNGLTFDGNGATFRVGTPGGLDRREFWFVGGSNLVVEDLTIVGADPAHTYDQNRAFQGGIELDGVAGATINQVAIDSVYGDFVTLDPLRGGPEFNSGAIVRPSSGIVIRDCQFSGAGRQGISFVSVAGATVTQVSLTNVALDTFDVEADQSGEGAHDVVIEGTTADHSNGPWFANGGNSRNTTGDITVSGNTMTGLGAGDVVEITAPQGTTRGPFVFSDNTMLAGASAYVAAFQLSGCASCDITANHVAFLSRGPPETAVHLVDCAAVMVTDNVFEGAGKQIVAVNSTYQASGNTFAT